MGYADSGVAGIGAGERATPMTVPMKMDDGGGSKFAEGRDSTVSMGETDGGEVAAPKDTVYLPVEWDGPVVSFVSFERRKRRVQTLKLET